MPQRNHRRAIAETRAAWLVRAVSFAAFVALMSWEWSRWPNGTPLLGPLGIVWYNDWSAGNVALVILSCGACSVFLWKPSIVTGVISGLGAVNWLCWGMLAMGIGC